MPNRLAHESSPYLLQHANNPVDWYPWGEEALSRARAEGKPIFLSIGYSACHWCHVMEHESFEDPELAARMNEWFVCIKVDREERPDLDQVYMNAVQLMTGRGGWPMSVFLTPELRPFFAGTYWPPRAQRGMPGFDQVLGAVHDAWTTRREQTRQSAEEITRHLQHAGQPEPAESELTGELLDRAFSKLDRAFDYQHGGFGGAPKFPHSMDLQLLLRIGQRRGLGAAEMMVRRTLDAMAAGGIYDHLGGGFARYSVDERWLVPHFEKMLYDNALLTIAYLEAFQLTGEADYERIVRETLEYVLRDMTDATGGFHSTEDADSEGEEGKFYLWTREEVLETLGSERGERFCQVYDVTANGNFEGRNILNLPKTLAQFAELHHVDERLLRRELSDDRARLLAARDLRVRPGKDDKILVSWNALMIDAFAQAGAVLNEERYTTAAERATRFLLTELRTPAGRLLHSWRHGKAKLPAYLDDYTYLANGCISLYEATFEESWFAAAVELLEIVMQHFHDAEDGGFYYTSDDHEALITRNKDFYDSSVPSSNGMAAQALLRAGKLTGRSAWIDAARRTLELGADVMAQSPTAAGQLLLALDLWLGPTYELALLGPSADARTRTVIQQLRRRFMPNRVVAARESATVTNGIAALDPFFAGKSPQGEPPTLYVCHDFQCDAPVSGREAEEWVVGSG